MATSAVESEDTRQRLSAVAQTKAELEAGQAADIGSSITLVWACMEALPRILTGAPCLICHEHHDPYACSKARYDTLKPNSTDPYWQCDAALPSCTPAFKRLIPPPEGHAWHASARIRCQTAQQATNPGP